MVDKQLVVILVSKWPRCESRHHGGWITTSPRVDTWAELCDQWEVAHDNRCLGKSVGRGASFLALSELPCVHHSEASIFIFLLLDEIPKDFP